MLQIIKITDSTVSIGTEDNKIINVPIGALNYDNPAIGDRVRIYGEGDSMIVALERRNHPEPVQEPLYDYSGNRKSINKHIFVWVANFFFGVLGVDRFLRGQIGLGILKLITGGGFGAWAIVDFVIALCKAYGNDYPDSENITFIKGKYA